MEATHNAENFELDSDDAYDGRCCEVFFTRKRQMIFHCSLCDDSKLGCFADFLKHLARQHTNDWPTTTKTTLTLAEEEEAAVEHVQSAETIDCNEVFEEYELLEVESLTESENVELLPADQNGDVDPSKFSQETLEITTLEKPNMYIPLTSDARVVYTHDSVSNTSPCNSQDSSFSFSPNPKRKKLTKKATSPGSDATRAERKHKCEHCGFAFKQLYNLRAHLRRHTDLKPFACTQCPKQFYSRSELETHARRHTGEKPYVCLDCGADYVTSGALNMHSKRHTNDKPHVCPHCPKSFYDTFQLSEHVVVHTQQRNHVCELCHATFQRRKSLVGHMKLHTNAREYVCTQCPAAFNQHQALTSHLKRKHKVSSPQSSDVGDAADALIEGSTVVCSHCQLEFSDEEALLVHEEQLHATVEEFVSDDDEEVLDD